MVQRITVAVPGATLQAQVHLKAHTRDSLGLIIAHPYPLLGGSLRDPVVSELFRAAAASPAFACVLRYNQRGVGSSSGSKLGGRRHDAADLAALVDFVLGQLRGTNKRVAVVGYSWGACLATAALACPRVTAYVGVSFPLGGLALVLQPRKHFAALCAASHVPRLLVLGSQDQYAKATTLQQLVLQQPGGAMLESWEAQQQAQQTQQQAQQTQQQAQQTQQQQQPEHQQREKQPPQQQQPEQQGDPSQDARKEGSQRRLDDTELTAAPAGPEGGSGRHSVSSLDGDSSSPAAAALQQQGEGLEGASPAAPAGPAGEAELHGQPSANTAAGANGTAPGRTSAALVQPSCSGAAGSCSSRGFGAAPLLLRVYPGVDHFWAGGELPLVVEEVVQWLEAVAQCQAA